MTTSTKPASTRISAARGSELRCRGWRQESLLRLLENNLENAERQEDLVVYASFAKAARDWDSYHKIVHALKNLQESQTLIIQSGKPIGIFNTHKMAPLVLMANGNIVGRWATPENFYELQDKGLTIWGGLTAADWQYIGSQGVIQGTYEILAQVAREHFKGSLKGKFVLTAGMGGMGGAQPLAGKLAGAVILVVEVDRARIEKRVAAGYCELIADDLDHALALVEEAQKKGIARSISVVGNAAEIYPELLKRGVIPDVVTDQTSAHDTLYGYVPVGLTIAETEAMRKSNPTEVRKRALESIAVEVQAMLEFKKKGSVVFDNGNNIRSQAAECGVTNAFDIDIFTARYLRPLFCKGIGPFRWIALTGEPNDIQYIDQLVLEHFPENELAANWIKLAGEHIKFEALPARICWMGHGERTKLALLVNDAVRDKKLSGPIAFTRDHLDGAAMTHPRIGTEGMLDGSDAISDWPLLNALLNTASAADLVAIHSGGGGYAGYMTSAGATITADGTDEAAQRLSTALTADTGLGVLRFADANYSEAQEAAKEHKLGL
ncbi:MAG: urocanate hydratase [Cyanobacteria bacterium SZAS-4]|nr:urocanate hydratase [Cyanobacteria bacterium SZAS-4]